MSDHPRDCPHGRQWGKCPHCDLIEASAEIAALKAGLERWVDKCYEADERKNLLLEENADLHEENERLHDLACADWFRCPVPQLNEANDALKAENERLRGDYKSMVDLANLHQEQHRMVAEHRDQLDVENERLRSTLAAKETVQRANEDEMSAENERLRDVADAALLMRSACPMDWTHGDCRDSQCAVVCCALAALEAEVGE